MDEPAGDSSRSGRSNSPRPVIKEITEEEEEEEIKAEEAVKRTELLGKMICQKI